jgi:Trk K+ transport system NAD-binding subunit
MDQKWDDIPNPDEQRKQRAMDALEINRIENEHERRVAANQEKENANDVLREGLGQQ